MDAISNDAILDPFKIGPSSLIGRTIALRVLFCTSISHLRRRLALLLRRLAAFVLPAVSWFHPRNTHRILAAVTLIAFLHRRGTNVRSRAESAYLCKFWRNLMRSALTYEEWAHAARMLERENAAARGASESDLYDEELVRNKLQELRQRREEGSLRDIVFCMRADLVRNLGNMCSPQLHKGRLQVPKLIKEYINEVSIQLRMVCTSDDSEELLLEEKLAFMHETRHSFGRTALLLSGGASLGAFHVGVVKTLVEHKLLPRIIAGSSVGSIVCAVLATRSWPELENFFEDSWHSLQFFDQMGGIFTVVKRMMTHGAVHEMRQLQWLLRHLTSNLTFQEAYDTTGRILCITVCSPRKHEPPRCLNYLTSPHVVIWSAVTASCAFPGLFEAQELMAKDRFGEIVPFQAPFLGGPEQSSGTSRRWRDGSLESDLPMMRLKELFNVNHFIVSQANPHIAPVLRVKELVRAYGGNFAAKLAHLAEMEIKHRCNQILELGFPLGGLAKLFAQEWEGDVTVVMPATLTQYLKIIQNPSHVELQKAINQGRRCTWEKLSTIKANCAIELVLDECVALLNHMRRLKRSAERAAASHGHTSAVKFSASRRIPSWNCIARENSSGSLDEEGVVEANSSNQHGTSHIGDSLGKGCRSQSSIHDASDGESESIDLNSWTRSGGPLMRTASANRFIIFMQNLEANSDLKCSPKDDDVDCSGRRDSCYNSIKGSTDRSSVNSDSDSRESAKFPMASTRILVNEGDLLQPERIHNGIMLSVVRRNSLSSPRTTGDFEQQQSSPTEIDAEVLQIENGDVSSNSDYEDNDGSEMKCASNAAEL